MPKAKVKSVERAKKLKVREQKKSRDVVRFKQKQAHSLEHFRSSLTEGYEFWLLHGSNFLVSSYDEGLWDPLFPEVYEGRAVSRTDLFRRLFKTHLDPTTNHLTPAGTKTVAWCSLKPDQMYALVYRARAVARKDGGNPFEPGQPEVWDFLNSVMANFVEKMDAIGRTEEGKFRLPVEDYGKLLPEAVAATIGNLTGVEDPTEDRTS